MIILGGKIERDRMVPLLSYFRKVRETLELALYDYQVFNHIPHIDYESKSPRVSCP
jgi:hypothetical protein